MSPRVAPFLLLTAWLGNEATAFPAPATSTVPLPGLFEPGLRDDIDLLLLPADRRPAANATVTAATRVKTGAVAIADVLLDPKSMREAIPSLVRAAVAATRPGERREFWPDRLIDWELEIPLFNLKGKGWLRQRDNLVEMTLVEGAFAPGQIRVRFAPATASASAGPATIVTCAVQIDFGSSNFILRRVARHDPWSETAMSAATAWVLLRAIALRAENPRTPSARRRPAAPIAAPVATALDGFFLGAPALAPLRAAGTVGAVRRASSGRLGWTSVATAVPGFFGPITTRLATPETWRAFPGWHSMKRRPGARSSSPVPSTSLSPSTPARDRATLVEVDDDLAFVDLDAIWSVDVTRAVRATAIDGSIRGAVFGWDTLPGDRPGSSLAILSMHPRLDAAGFIERRLIAAEPLLEHGLALALTYVDAAAVADSLERPPVPDAP